MDNYNPSQIEQEKYRYVRTVTGNLNSNITQKKWKISHQPITSSFALVKKYIHFNQINIVKYFTFMKVVYFFYITLRNKHHPVFQHTIIEKIVKFKANNSDLYKKSSFQSYY